MPFSNKGAELASKTDKTIFHAFRLLGWEATWKMLQARTKFNDHRLSSGLKRFKQAGAIKKGWSESYDSPVWRWKEPLFGTPSVPIVKRETKRLVDGMKKAREIERTKWVDYGGYRFGRGSIIPLRPNESFRRKRPSKV